MSHEEIRKWIAGGDVRRAIDALLDFLQNEKNAEALANELILLSARLVNSERSQRLGLIGQEEATRVRAQIDLAVLEIAGEMKEMLAVSDSQSHPGPLKKEKITHILFLESNPFPEKPLSSAEESRELGLVFRNHPHRDRFLLQKEFALTPKLLLRIINEDRPDLLHLSAFANESGIYLLGEDDSPQLMGNEALLALFGLMEAPPRAIFFNTWVSTEMALALSAKISWVIGVNQLISNRAAISFVTGFYQAIAYGKEIPAAFETGRQTLLLENLEAERHKLFLAENGKIVL